MNVEIDRDGCISCKQCWTLCPHIFEENLEDGKSMVVEIFRNDSNIAAGSIGEEHESCVVEAADACPVSVIHLE